jgi:hypothetical protein
LTILLIMQSCKPTDTPVRHGVNTDRLTDTHLQKEDKGCTDAVTGAGTRKERPWVCTVLTGTYWNLNGAEDSDLFKFVGSVMATGSTDDIMKSDSD